MWANQLAIFMVLRALLIVHKHKIPQIQGCCSKADPEFLHYYYCAEEKQTENHLQKKNIVYLLNVLFCFEWLNFILGGMTVWAPLRTGVLTVTMLP